VTLPPNVLQSAVSGEWYDVNGDLAGDELCDLLAGRAAQGQPLRAVRLRGARITGELDLYATTLVCPLALDGCELERPLGLIDATAPAISLRACTVPAVHASRLETRGNLDLGESEVAQDVQLVGARIGGVLLMHGTQIAGLNKLAVIGDGLTAAQVLARDGFSAVGEVRMVAARIERSIELDGATLRNPGGRALNLELVTVGGSLFCRSGFSAEGEVRLAAASVADQVTFSRAVLTNPPGHALFAERLQVDGHMYCSDGFQATGGVNLLAARIARRLVFSDAARLAADDRTVLNLETAQVGALLLNGKAAPEGTINLAFARIGIMLDRPYGKLDAWPVCELDGCTYDRIQSGSAVTVRHRLRWLPRDARYEPQPYDQLAAAYRSAGHDADARVVGIEKERQRARTLPPPARIWSRFLDVTVGHGYRLWQAGVWLLVLLALGSLAFGLAFDAGAAAGADVTNTKALAQAPPFHPVFFTADLIVPVISLGQDAAWTASSTAAQWTAFCLTVCGWLLTAAFVAGLAVRRQ
jgi:hypothetical protein